MIEKQQGIVSDLDTLFNILPDMVCIASTDGYFKYLNPEWEKTLGYSLKELLSKPLFDFIHPDDHEPTQREIKRQLSGKKTLNFENRYRCKDGSYRFLQWHAAPAKGDKLFAVARDITEQKKKNEALLESEERYIGLFERSFELVYLCDLEGNFIDANKAALESLGYEKKDINTLNFISLLDKDQLPVALKKMKEILETGSQKKETEYRLIKKNGEYLYVENKGSLVYRDGKPFAIQGIARDITARRQAEKELQQSEQKYRSMMEAMTDPCYICSYDFHIEYMNQAMMEKIGYDAIG